MSKETLKNLIELVPESDIEVLYRVIVKFVPEVKAEPGELEALLEGREDRKKNGKVPHDAVNWD